MIPRIKVRHIAIKAKKIKPGRRENKKKKKGKIKINKIDYNGSEITDSQKIANSFKDNRTET